jgi:hypothetical protein
LATRILDPSASLAEEQGAESAGAIDCNFEIVAFAKTRRRRSFCEGPPAPFHHGHGIYIKAV